MKLMRIVVAVVASLALQHTVQAASVVRSAAGADPAAIQATVDQFRTDLGGSNNGVGGTFATGRREINWDGVSDDAAAPANLNADFFNATSPRGAILVPVGGNGFQVSMDSNNPPDADGDLIEFGNLNLNYAASFQMFSPERLFTPLGDNTMEVTFRVPGSGVPATVKGFGAVFTDVDAANVTSIQLFSPGGGSFGIFFVPPANQGLSFLGVSFNGSERVSRVRIHTGNVVIGTSDDGGAANDQVVMDDFIYAEPQAFAKVWNGTGADQNWTTAGNWVNGVAPVAGDALEFPAGAAQLIAINDFPTGTNFTALLISGNSYFIGGNAVNLSNGILTTNATGSNFLFLPFKLTASTGVQSFISSTAGTTLSITSTTIDLNNNVLTLAGAGNQEFLETIIGGSGSIIKAGTGTATFGDDNTYTGVNHIDAGTLVIHGNQPNSFILLNGGTLGGRGTTGPITTSGDNGGTISPGAGPGILNVQGNVSASSAATLTVEMNGPTVGSGYDQLNVQGHINLSSALSTPPALNVTLGYTPAPGDSFTIVNNDGGDAVIGTFNGLAEGAILMANGTPLAITYQGGDGNDIVLAVPRLAVSGDVALIEGDAGTKNAVFTVTLAPALNAPVTVDFATADASAVAPGDYQTQNGTLTFVPGQVTKTVTIPVTGDTVDENNEGFFVLFSNATNTAFADLAREVTILDNDAPPSITINDVTLAEGTGGTSTASFTVTLSAASGRTASVNFATANNTAIAPGDYTAKSGKLTFPPGTTTQPLKVVVRPDSGFEADENFRVNLSGALNATIADNQGVATLNNDDGPPAISILKTQVVEGNSGTTNAVFTVRLSAATTQTVTVDFATLNGSAVAPGDYTATANTLTFAAGATTQTLSVPVKGDMLNEPAESFLVVFSNPANATLATDTAPGVILNDDPDPSLSITNVAIIEGNAGTVLATFTVSLTAASAKSISVDFATANGTATAGSDYVAKTGTLGFSPGTTSRTLTVTVKGDTVLEADETLFVNLTGAHNASIADNQGQGTITNDDAS